MAKGFTVKVEVDSPNTLTHKPFSNAFEAVKYLLKYCTPEERLELFGDYCKACGTDDPRCQCDNDE